MQYKDQGFPHGHDAQACRLVCESETPTALECKVHFAGQQFSRHCASSGTISSLA